MVTTHGLSGMACGRTRLTRSRGAVDAVTFPRRPACGNICSIRARQGSKKGALMPGEPDLYDYARQTCGLDLHGYAVSAAREVAREFVKAAWEAGHDHVVLIHGAQAARHPRSELVLNGYGGIKWSLRAMLRGGDFDPTLVAPTPRCTGSSRHG
jgi:Smr domain-containing protein